METEHITRIVNLMTESDLTEFEIEQEGLKLRICRASKNPVPVIAQQPIMAALPVAAPAPAPTPTLNGSPEPTSSASGKVIKSPMVGVFYRAPSPQSPAFVNIGDSVKAETVVCIIETMKMMNEIQADEVGTIAEILVENGQGVEFGQPLFRLK